MNPLEPVPPLLPLPALEQIVAQQTPDINQAIDDLDQTLRTSATAQPAASMQQQALPQQPLPQPQPQPQPQSQQQSQQHQQQQHQQQGAQAASLAGQQQQQQQQLQQTKASRASFLPNQWRLGGHLDSGPSSA